MWLCCRLLLCKACLSCTNKCSLSLVDRLWRKMYSGAREIFTFWESIALKDMLKETSLSFLYTEILGTERLGNDITCCHSFSIQTVNSSLLLQPSVEGKNLKFSVLIPFVTRQCFQQAVTDQWMDEPEIKCQHENPDRNAPKTGQFVGRLLKRRKGRLQSTFWPAKQFFRLQICQQTVIGPEKWFL